ncbi:MAG: MMPL family transporter [Chloroflexota bacterium]|nr:MMPL family transporter [Chloroflexota bacterium]MDE2894228.1 MMPL family transporter [Chloroflexota bacterium]
MNDILGNLSRLVTARPWVTIGVLLLITVILAAGADRRVPIVDGTDLALLPQDGPIVAAIGEINEHFEASGDVRLVTLVFRGESLTPEGLAQMSALLGGIASDPDVAMLLTPTDAIISPAQLIQAALGVENFDAVSQAEIDAVGAAPEFAPIIDAFTGTDVDGTAVAIATVRLRNTQDERVGDAERRIAEMATSDEGPLQVSSVSPIVVEDEYKQATEDGMAPLIGVALLLIAVLILLFLRTLSDLVLALVGLLLSIIWVVGLEGWLGPGALGVIGPPNALTALVPIIIIGLTVDYAIQVVSNYREQRATGVPVLEAVRSGMRHVVIPLLLAAVTTMVSLLANLFSPVEIVGDFGVVAAFGVGMSLFVMLTLVPAGRAIIDGRRESRGTLPPQRLIAQAIPGVARAAEVLGANVALRPAPFLLVVLAVTIGFGVAASDLESEFSIRDILPRGGTVLEDWDTLDAAIGGPAEVTSVLIKAEATETRTLLNLRDLAAVFEDDGSRPAFAAGPLQTSYELIVRDWVMDSGDPADNYDPELAAMFREASAGLELDPALMQEILNRLETLEPALSHALVNNPDGLDTILVQFPTMSGDSVGARQVQPELEALWVGTDEAITATSEGIIGVTITDSITDRQTEAISITIAAALGILAIFFWATHRQPVLAVIAVVPIIFVLIWVLGTMALLGIPYSLVTSIITALSIGIGVDYTIHLIHRYREEFTRLRDPEQAAIRTLATTGSALLGSALTTALGLGVLIASPLLASQQFGITAAITIAYSLIVSILVVPPTMTVWGAFQNMRLRSAMQRMWDDLDEAIDETQERHERESNPS